MKVDIKDFSYEELQNWILEIGESKFRARQIYEWLTRGALQFCEMTNLSKKLQEKLDDLAEIHAPVIEDKFVSQIDGTVKYLMRLYDGEYVECVIMRYKYGLSMCISSQVGCNMGCAFCASTIGGKIRNLSAGEMIGQITTAQRDLGERIAHVVIMGMGEPMDNYDAVVKFLRMANDENGLGIGLRHITVSTCGLVPNMLRLAKENLPITLSVSLHAPDDEIRSRLMPVNRRYQIAEVVAAIDTYLAITGRRVSIEYAMISGVNDSVSCARKLGELLSGKLIHVNLIPVNPISEDGFKRSSDRNLQIFEEELKKYKINVTIRRKMGSDINASCGQLRKNRKEAMNQSAE